MLYHTSPVEITKIDTNGRFGKFLFFAANAYKMGVESVITYEIDETALKIAEAGHLFYDENAEKLGQLVHELAEKLDVTDDVAAALIDESTDTYSENTSDPAEDGWDVQMFTARAAEILGYDGVRVADEHGTSYIIDATRVQMRRTEA